MLSELGTRGKPVRIVNGVYNIDLGGNALAQILFLMAAGQNYEDK